jgi:SAM-dependent methyltransferase
MLPDGWLREDEAEELRRLAKDRTVLELGAWKGRSTVVLAEVASYVVSVDRHRGIEEIGESDALDEYLANVRSLSNVAIVIAEFEDILPFLDKFGLVYVDGDHGVAAVSRDTHSARFRAWDVIAFHDWDFPAVRDTVTTIFKRPPNGLVGSVASYHVGEE